MIVLQYKNSKSTFKETSELAILIFEKLNVDEKDSFIKKIIEKKEADLILQELRSNIENKINNREISNITRIKDVVFGEDTISLNLSNSMHKQAFFLIKAYNLIYEFKESHSGLLKVEKIDDSQFVFNSST